MKMFNNFTKDAGDYSNNTIGTSGRQNLGLKSNVPYKSLFYNNDDGKHYIHDTKKKKIIETNLFGIPVLSINPDFTGKASYNQRINSGSIKLISQNPDKLSYFPQPKKFIGYPQFPHPLVSPLSNNENMSKNKKMNEIVAETRLISSTRNKVLVNRGKSMGNLDYLTGSVSDYINKDDTDYKVLKQVTETIDEEKSYFSKYQKYRLKKEGYNSLKKFRDRILENESDKINGKKMKRPPQIFFNKYNICHKLIKNSNLISKNKLKNIYYEEMYKSIYRANGEVYDRKTHLNRIFGEQYENSRTPKRIFDTSTGLRNSMDNYQNSDKKSLDSNNHYQIRNQLIKNHNSTSNIDQTPNKAYHSKQYISCQPYKNRNNNLTNVKNEFYKVNNLTEFNTISYCNKEQNELKNNKNNNFYGRLFLPSINKFKRNDIERYENVKNIINQAIPENKDELLLTILSDFKKQVKVSPLINKIRSTKNVFNECKHEQQLLPGFKKPQIIQRYYRKKREPNYINGLDLYKNELDLYNKVNPSFYKKIEGIEAERYKLFMERKNQKNKSNENTNNINKLLISKCSSMDNIHEIGNTSSKSFV